MTEINSASEISSMKIISVSGEVRSFSFQALEAAKNGDFEQADELLQKAKEADLIAHKEQMDILTREANGEVPVFNTLAVHAQDHFMCSSLAYELIKEIIILYKDRKENR